MLSCGSKGLKSIALGSGVSLHPTRLSTTSHGCFKELKCGEPPRQHVLPFGSGIIQVRDNSHQGILLAEQGYSMSAETLRLLVSVKGKPFEGSL